MDVKVTEIMTKKVETLDSDRTVFDAIEKIVSKRIRSVLVKDGNDYGVVTVRDIVFKCLAKGLDPKKVKLKEIVTKPLITVEKDAKLSEVVEILRKNNIARVFVKEGDKIVGVVSLMDILAYFITRP